MGNKHTKEDLKLYQSLDLKTKIQLTQDRIRAWVKEYGEDGVYISFSGGKDSTVLLDIVRSIYPDIIAVFVDTGLEYPEIKQFVKTFDNVVTLRPKMNFKEVLTKYGYPLISKEVAHKIEITRKRPNGKTANAFSKDSDYYKKYGEKFSCAKWVPLLESDIPISKMCCKIMKENPMNDYEKETGRHGFIGSTADESNTRKNSWLRNGCNNFDGVNPKSQPLMFWTEQDILMYIKENEIKIASVYGEIETYIYRDHKKGGKNHERLRTTDCDRTGCIFCGFGLHSESSKLNKVNKRTEVRKDRLESRFERLKRTHRALWEYCIGGGEFVEREVIIKYGDVGVKVESGRETKKVMVWIPSKDGSGLGLGRIFEMLCELYGDGFVRW